MSWFLSTTLLIRFSALAPWRSGFRLQEPNILYPLPQVLDLKLEVLGETSCASTISYLDSGVVFIGSCFGDSQLIKLHTESDESGSNVEVMCSRL